MKQLFNKTGMMFVSLLRRDWLKLLLWGIGLAIFSGGLSGAMYEIYGKDKVGLLGLYETMKNPAMIALVGPTASTAEEYTAASMFAHELTLFTAVIFAIIAIMHVISRTRSEEDNGTLELFRSFQVGRLANTTAVIIEMLLFHLVTALTIAVLIQVQDVPHFQDFNTNLLFGVSMCSQGFLWSIIALIFVQLCSTSSSARGFSFSFLGLLYILRMLTDMENVDLSWFNPLSWCYLTEIYVNNHWKPILYTVLLSLFLLLVVYILEQARDIGSGYFPERNGKLRASKSLLSLPGFILHLQKGYISAWLISLFVFGAMYGSIFGDIDKFVEDSEVMQMMFLHNSDFSLAEQFMSTLFLIMAVITAIFAVMSLNKIVAEEKKGRLEQLYAMKNSRTAFYLIHVLIALFCATVGQFVSALGLFVSESMVMKEPIPLQVVLEAGMVWLPAIIFFVAIVAFLAGFLPRLMQIIWGYLLYCFFIGYIGQLLDIPDIIKDLNILYHIPQLPTAEMNWENIFIISGISLVLLLAGYIGYTRRDLISD